MASDHARADHDLGAEQKERIFRAMVSTNADAARLELSRDIEAFAVLYLTLDPCRAEPNEKLCQLS